MLAGYTSVILVVTGVLTVLAAVGVFFPRQVLDLIFGITSGDAATIAIGRHWSLLIGLIGGLLIYAGYHEEARVPVMIAAATEKLVLGALVVAGPLRTRRVTMLVVGADAVMAILYVIILANHGF